MPAPATQPSIGMHALRNTAKLRMAFRQRGTEHLLEHAVDGLQHQLRGIAVEQDGAGANGRADEGRAQQVQQRRKLGVPPDVVHCNILPAPAPPLRMALLRPVQMRRLVAAGSKACTARAEGLANMPPTGLHVATKLQGWICSIWQARAQAFSKFDQDALSRDIDSKASCVIGKLGRAPDIAASTHRDESMQSGRPD